MYSVEITSDDGIIFEEVTRWELIQEDSVSKGGKMSDEQEKKAIYLSEDLYKQIDERVNITGFGSVEEYVTFVLQEVLKDDEVEEQVSFSPEEEEEVKKRLKALGYLD